MLRHLPFVGAVLAFAVPAGANDLFVNPSRPGAFPTLQAALDAALPGDRILVETALPQAAQTIIRKSVTIESIDGQRKLLPYVGTATSPGRVLIQALTPGMPLVLRKLDFRFTRLAGGDRNLVGIRTEGGEVLGVVHLDGTSLENEPFRPVYSSLLMDVHVTELWIRDSRLVARDTAAGDGCTTLPDNMCSDALRAMCRILVIEDSELRGGHANFLRYAPCVNASEMPFGGGGGMALHAMTDATILVRSHFSDGNGGDVQIGPWTTPPKPGMAMRSEFIEPGGFFESYNSVIENSRDGQMLTAENLDRAPAVQINLPESPLKLDGNVRPGGTLDVAYQPVPFYPGMVILGTRWGFQKIPQLGFFWIHEGSLIGKFIFNMPGVLTLPVPMDTSLVGRPIIGQPLVLYDAIGLSNPSFIQVRN